MDGGDASTGETLEVTRGTSAEIRIRFLERDEPNAHGDDPSVSRVDLIAGEITGWNANRDADTNPTTRVAAQWNRDEWTKRSGQASMSSSIDNVSSDLYVRLRGTNGTELEPAVDPRGEDPWSDLWFYSNPTFVRVR